MTARYIEVREVTEVELVRTIQGPPLHGPQAAGLLSFSNLSRSVIIATMSRRFTSQATGADVYVFSNDHCPVHVHARHRGQGWIARVKLSYLSSEVELMSIAPAKSIPP